MLTRNEIIPLSLSGDLRQGGYRLNGVINGDTDAVEPGLNLSALGKSLSEFNDPIFREFLNCHTLTQPDFSFTRYNSQSNWQAATADAFIAGLDVQDISFTVVASPSNPHEDTSWSFATIIQHILESHSNIIYDADGSNGSPDGIVTTLDFDYAGSTTFSSVSDRYIVGHSQNMWTTLQGIGGGEEGGGEFYRIWCDRQNTIHYQPAPPFISPQPTAKGNLNKAHIRGTVQVHFNNTGPGQRIGQVQIVAGINPETIFTAKYPATQQTGRILKKQSGIWANDQTKADTLAEYLYKWVTRAYTLTVEVDPGLVLFGDNSLGLDLGDRVTLTYNGPAEDANTGAGVHLNLSAQSLFVYGVNVSFDQQRRAATATLTLEHDNSA